MQFPCRMIIILFSDYMGMGGGRRGESVFVRLLKMAN